MKQNKILLFIYIFIGLGTMVFAQNSHKYIVFFERSNKITRDISRDNLMKNLKIEMDKSVAAIQFFLKKDTSLEKLWSSNAIVVSLSKSDMQKIATLTNVLEVSRADQKFTLPEEEERSVIAPERTAQWGVRQINASKVWKELKVDGSGIVVGCIDSGIFAEHPAFKGQIIAYKDFTKGGNSKKPSDGLGHGTHVAGTIAGKKSGIGVAPGAKLLIAKIFDRNGRTTLETMLKAMQWMLSPSKTNSSAAPRVINCSWCSKKTNSKQFWNILEAWNAASIIPVFGAGNNGNMGGKVGTPGNYPHAFAVGATQKKDKFFAISSQGPSVWNGKTYIKPDMTAPGRNILSAGNTGGSLLKSGTSMAAPHVTGTIALMLSANPFLTNNEVVKILKETALDLGVTGPDNKFGYGRVDAYKAVKKSMESFDFANASEELNDLMDQELALTGDENNTVLSDGYASYIVNYGREMSEVEFTKLYARIKATGSDDAKQLIWEIKKVRNFEKLQK